MFWHNNYAPSVQIDSLLNEEDITLNKLMDAEDILQECKSQNKKLIEFLARSDILEELVNLIIEEPSEDLEERSRYKYSNVACELLTCDVPALTEKIAGNEALLSKLYSFIEKDEPLNPLLASFFSKTLHALLRRASDQNWFSHQFVCLQVLEALKSRKNCVDLLLQHIQTSAIMDLILILLTKVEDNEMHQNLLNTELSEFQWLDDQQLIPRVVKLLSPQSDLENHANASQLLCDVIKSPRTESEKKPDPILQTLQSEETIKLILDVILTGEKLESSIVGGVRVLINLIGQKESKNPDSTETYGAPFNNVVKDEQRDKFALVIIPYLDKFNQLLLDPPEKPSVITTAGFLEKPFGRSRLYILKLYYSLLSTENSEVFKKFAELDTFNILLDLFFQFAWNNFLHTQVQQCISLVINCDCSEINEIIYSNIFIKSKLIDRILEAWENNDNNTLNKQNGVRQGYMGHLIIIANEIVTRCKENNVLLNYIKTNLSEGTIQKWESFVSSELNEINEKQQMTLGEPPESYMMSSSDNSDEYTSFPQDTYGQEFFNNFQEQSAISVYADQDSSFRIEKFDGGNAFQNSMSQLNHSPFNVNDNDYEKSQELFDKICDEKKFDDVTEDDQWAQTRDFQLDKSDWLRKKKNSSSSSDEDDEDDSNDLPTEADATDPWNSMKPLSAPGAASINLWNTDSPQPVEQTGWANFDSAFAADNFSSSFNTDISFEVEPCNEAKAELPEVPIVNENISVLDTRTGSNLNNSKNEENVNETTITKTLKTEETNVSNSDCIEPSTNIPDSNANLAVVENRTSESKDVSKSLEESPSSISELPSENLTTVQAVTSATDNVPPITTASSELPK